MFEKLFFEAEKKDYFLRVLGLSFLITFILGVFNSFIGNNSLFLVALVSLALSYPVVSYIRSMTKEEVEKAMKSSLLLRRHEKELVVFWAIFVGVTVGFYLISLLFPLDFTYQEAFMGKVNGYITQGSHGFVSVFSNNLIVTFFTFILSFLVFSGLLFVLVWNASIVAFYLHSLGSHSTALLYGLNLLPHGLLEVGGYVFAGVAGALLAYRIDRTQKFKHAFSHAFVYDLLILILGALFLVFIGAFTETL